MPPSSSNLQTSQTTNKRQRSCGSFKGLCPTRPGETPTATVGGIFGGPSCFRHHPEPSKQGLLGRVPFEGTQVPERCFGVRVGASQRYLLHFHCTGVARQRGVRAPGYRHPNVSVFCYGFGIEDFANFGVFQGHLQQQDRIFGGECLSGIG